MTLVEICVDDVGGAHAAAAGGADRVELCAALSEGGITPSAGFVASSVEAAPQLAHRVLVRPRAGDFVYDADEVAVMCDDIVGLRRLGVGFVIGATLPSGELDVDVLRRLSDAAEGAPLTCHKAFDGTPDLVASVGVLVGLGFRTVLTGGGPGRAVDNLGQLRRVVDAAGDRLEVLVGGGVRPDNVRQVVEETGARAVHLRAPAPPAAGTADPAFGERRRTDAELVARVVAQVRGR